MEAKISDLIEIMKGIAPPHLAEEWDNVGLQVGGTDWPARLVWVALDPRPGIVAQAAEAGVDLLITHHPLIFKPLRSIDTATPTGLSIARALAARTAIYSAHTNLDSARDGLNDLLAETIGLTGLRPMDPAPVEAGTGQGEGLGRIGRLPEAMDLAAFAARLKHLFGKESLVRMSGRSDLRVETVAVCSGSGSSLMSRFLGSEAQVFVTGDLRYHDALDALDADRGLVDIGHFASEVIGVEMLVKRIKEAAGAAGLDLSVAPCVGEPDPFNAL